MHAAHRPIYGTSVAVVAAQIVDPASKEAVCARCGIDFKRTVRNDRPLARICRDCKKVAPRFIQGENHDHNPHHRPAAAGNQAAYATAADH